MLVCVCVCACMSRASGNNALCYFLSYVAYTSGGTAVPSSRTGGRVNSPYVASLSQGGTASASQTRVLWRMNTKLALDATLHSAEGILYYSTSTHASYFHSILLHSL